MNDPHLTALPTAPAVPENIQSDVALTALVATGAQFLVAIINYLATRKRKK